jgi:hypothetical protein
LMVLQWVSLFNEALSTPCFSFKKFTQHGYTQYCICPPKLQRLLSDHHDCTCHYIPVYIDTGTSCVQLFSKQ